MTAIEGCHVVDNRLRVVDFSTHLSGPMAAHLLVEAGADVVKIEHPVRGDGNRGNEPRIAGVSDMHLGLNPGTRSLAVSTRSPHWSEVVAAAVGWADAVIVGNRPKDSAKRGLDFPTLVAANHQLVYCVISGYGLRGPWAEYSAHGQNMDAYAGRVELEWDEDGQPATRLGWRSAGTTLAGMFGAMGVLAGVVRRDRGGGAQFVHTSIWQSAMWWNWRDLNTLANLDRGWVEYRDMGSRYNVYGTADDRAVLVCPVEKRFWDPFCDIAGLPEELRDRGDWTHSMEFGFDDEKPVIAQAVRRKTLDEWREALLAADIPFAPVLTLDEAMSSEHAAVNDVLRSTTTAAGDRVEVTASPLRIDRDLDSALEPGLEDLAPPPDVGQHNDELLAELGLEQLVGEDLSG
jgi:crotonobetainyl-CoA:carnitine CoA-transferase CaiB-like acyl-CoA transferase